MLCRGSLRPERSRETRWKSGHLEGGIEGIGQLESQRQDLVTSQPRRPSLRRLQGLLCDLQSNILTWNYDELLDPEYFV